MLMASMTTLMAGVGLVATAPYLPTRLALLERAGGVLFCAGLMFVGAGLAMIGF